MIEHTVANAVKKVARKISNEERLKYVCPKVFEEVCEVNGWCFEYYPEINGWQADWWADIIIDGQIVRVSGTMYDGTASIYIG